MLGDMSNITLGMTLFPRGYAGHIAQHTRQHLYNGTSWSFFLALKGSDETSL